LRADERDDLFGDHLSALEQAPGVSQSTELKRKAQTVLRATTSLNDLNITITENVVAEQHDLIGGQAEQKSALALGQHGASWHERLSQLNYRLFWTTLGP
jgi:hypothetical protein